ncbi:NlpC/P60 family protein [Haloglycomyces albus]|uniref:C40 family peptidase n=1 Tax=Haloglycomyces albus TaxID=526067 RepID=UPI00046D29E4|nr:C40 family peptidase [Haloglycomyces albus]
MTPSLRKPQRVLTWTVTLGLLSTLAAGPAFAQRDVDDIEDDIEQEDETLQATIEEYNALSEDISDTDQAITEVTDELEPYEEELEELRSRVADYLAEIHMNQGQSELRTVLESGSPDDYVERLTQMGAATMYRSDDINDLVTVAEDYQERLEVLEELQSDQAEQEAELDELITDIESRISDLQDEWQTAPGNAIADYGIDYIPGDRGDIVRRALNNVGAPYRWAESGPNGYDCSGLILDAYREIGISLPHNARMQYNQAAIISRDELQPGDLVFYNGLNHVGMYIGEGMIVHAATFGTPVQVVSIDHGNSYYGSGRIL